MTKLMLAVLSLAMASALLAQPTTPPAQQVGQSQAAQANFSLVTSKQIYCVGERPRYLISGAVELVGKPIIWASFFTPTGSDKALVMEDNTSYGHRLSSDQNGMAFWSAVGNVFSIKDAGRWTKFATINGVSVPAKFEVGFCGEEVLYPWTTRLTPASGTTLWYRVGSSSTTDISVVMEGGAMDTSRIRGWRVIVDNQNATAAVNALPSGGIGELFAVEPTPTSGGYPSGLVIRIPYPTRFLTPGFHEFAVEIELVNGSHLFASAQYDVRQLVETGQRFPQPLPETPLSCKAQQDIIPVGEYANLGAVGGDGAYVWQAIGGEPVRWTGQYFGTKFGQPGVYNVAVVSGKQQAICTVKVVVALPTQSVSAMPTPPTTKP